MEIKVNEKYSVLVDEEDVPLIEGLKLRIIETKNGKPICLVYINRTIRYKYIHQLILGPKNKSQVAFFKDGNSLNCKKNNVSYISRNLHSHINASFKNITKYKGVSKVCQARIKYENKLYRIGNYANEKAAALAYNLKAIELFGSDMAVLNKI